MKSRDDPENGEIRIEQFLTHPAVNLHVSPSTQNQAVNALVFLYKQVLKHQFDQKADAVCGKTKKNIPVAMSREEVAKVISFISGVPAAWAISEYECTVSQTESL